MYKNFVRRNDQCWKTKQENKGTHLPATASKLVTLRHLANIDTNHSLTETHADLSKNLGVLVVSNGLDNSTGTLLSIARLEDTRANEDTIAAQLHHKRRIGGSSNTTSGEVDNGQTAELGGLADKLVGSLDFTGEGAELGLGVRTGKEDAAGLGDLCADGAHVLHGLDDISGAGFTLGADHGGTLGDATEGLAEVAAAAHEGNLVAVLGDVVDIVGGGQDFGLVNVVDANGLKDLW